ncbi:MAG: tetratricopeptide repeat protein [Bacteroidia bacterium]
MPVVVDFWAPWCGPCRVLGPVIEALAAEAGGRWELVKLNTEEHQQIAAQYQIMSIPAVKMFHRGAVVAEFTGNLPRPQIQRWLDDHIPDPRKIHLANFMSLLQQGDLVQAEPVFEQFVETYPDLAEARVKLAALRTRQDPEAARALVADIEEGQALYDEATGVRALARLMDCPLDTGGSITDSLAQARQAWTQADPERSLQHLIDAVMVNKAYCEELPRLATLAIFRLLGEAHPLTRKFRPYFSMALY